MRLLVAGKAVCSGVWWGRVPRKSILEELRGSSALSSSDPECFVSSGPPPFKTTGALKISSREGGRSRWRGPLKPKSLLFLLSPPSHLKPQQRPKKLATQTQNSSFALADSCGLVGPLTIWQKARVGWFLGPFSALASWGVFKVPRGTPCAWRVPGWQGGAMFSAGFRGKVLADSRGLGSRPFQAEV